MDIYFTFNFKAYTLIFLVPALLFLIIAYYRRTVPAVSRVWRNILISSRLLALCLLLWMIFQPVLHIRLQHAEPAHVGVVIDNSASMQTVNQNKQRADEVCTALNQAVFQRWAQTYEISYYSVSDQLTRLHGQAAVDTLKFNGPLTNLGEVVNPKSNQWIQNSVDALLLFSDGIHNWGESPLSGLSRSAIPVHTVRTGSLQQAPDLLLTRVIYPDVVFTGEAIEITAFFRGTGYAGQQAEIMLRGNGLSANQQQIVIPPQGLETSVTFKTRFEQPGLINAVLSLSQLEDESNTNNNQQQLLFHVLKGRYRVLLLGAAPHPDLGLLKRLLNRSEMMNLTVRTLKSTNTFYEGAWLSENKLSGMDVIILYGLPSRTVASSLWNEIVSLLIQQKKPVLWIAAGGIDLARLQNIISILPVNKIESDHEHLLQPKFNAQQSLHPLLQSDQDFPAYQQKWNTMPPIYSGWKQIQLKPESITLIHGIPLSGSGKDTLPLLTSRHAQDEKAAALLATGINRWHLLAAGLGEPTPPFVSFLPHIVRRLAIKEDIAPVRMVSDRLVYNAGENIQVMIHINNAQYQPVNDAEIQLLLETQNSKVTPLPVKSVDQGVYIAEFRRFLQGAYQLKLNAVYNGNVLGKDSLAFHIRNFQPEQTRTRVNHTLLKALSEQTGGYSSVSDSLLFLLGQISYPQKTYDETRHVALYFSPWILTVIVLLLSVEWLIRKRKGML